MPVELKTTGNLREFLATAIVDVREKKLGVEEASRMVKLAAQINESFYSELKAKALARVGGEQTPSLGGLSLGGAQKD